jgi:hypothetical protein
MARSTALVFILFIVLAAPHNATAQGLLGERHVGVAFDMYWVGNDPPEQGAGAGVNWPLGSSFDVSVGYSRVGFEGSSSDASVVGLGLSIHGDTENTVAPYAEVSGGAAFAESDEAYSAALDVGAQVALSSRVALTPELGVGIAWAEDADTITILSFGLFADVYVTKRLVLLLGGGLDYSPDLHDDETSAGASVGLAFVL